MNQEFISYETLNPFGLLEQITKTAINFSNIGITEFSIKCEEKEFQLLKYQLTDKFGRYGTKIPKFDDHIEIEIYGLKFKAESNSSK